MVDNMAAAKLGRALTEIHGIIIDEVGSLLQAQE
jgi:nucleoside-triphosphatase THEP1